LWRKSSVSSYCGRQIKGRGFGQTRRTEENEELLIIKKFNDLYNDHIL